MKLQDRKIHNAETFRRLKNIDFARNTSMGRISLRIASKVKSKQLFAISHRNVPVLVCIGIP